MKHVVITGAADGIGRALAMRFAHADYAVTGVDVDADRAAEVARNNKGVAFVLGDLSDEMATLVPALLQKPPIDVLIHNAGINAVGRFVDMDMRDQERVIAVNLEAPMVLTSALLHARHIRDGGSLVFISSLSHQVSYPGAAAYAASKSGLFSYARSLSVALASRNIHVLTVFPGPTRTAHARRYSPDNAREDRRMAPDALADRIFKATVKRKRTLIPGCGNRLFAWVGKWLPGMAERAMKKAIWEKIQPPLGIRTK